MRVLAAILAFLMIGVASAEPSVIIGRGVSNEPYAEIACPSGAICMNSLYIWTLIAEQTVSGPTIRGHINAVAVQPNLATSKYARSVELFVLEPIEAVARTEAAEPTHRIIALSPRDRRGRYCIPMDPSEIGLLVKSSVSENGYRCFRKRSVMRSNNSLDGTRGG